MILVEKSILNAYQYGHTSQKIAIIILEETLVKQNNWKCDLMFQLT